MAGVSVSVLGPPDVALAGGDPNENSLVVQVRHGATSFLFTGDAEQAGERFLVEEYGDMLRTTVLRAGHHGSATSTGDALLSVTQPRAAVLSAPYNSQYGHPHEETLRRLADRAVPSYWTTTHGSSVFASSGTHVTAQSHSRRRPIEAPARSPNRSR
ncbi:MAG: hypothetical protein J07HX5_00484 [halophilic archaeon J07HX5]|nr:MAG: hypothetical protein J07HX5_00484 [halophilic archaeon J07HX5]